MALDPAVILSGPTALNVLLSSAGMMVGAAGLGALVWKPVGKAILPDLAETYLRDFLPFDRVLNDEQTIRCKDGRLVQVIALGGNDSGALSRRDKDQLFDKRKAFFDAFEEKTEVEVTAITLRRRTIVAADGRWDHSALQEMFDLYHAGFADSYVNSHYIILSVGSGTREGRAKLRDAVAHAMAALDDFAPQILANGKKGYSPLLSFWSEVINPGNPAPVGRQHHGISAGLCGGSVNFLDQGGVLEFRDGPHVTYGIAIGVPRWGENTAEMTVSRLMSLPCEMTIVHLVQPRPTLQAQALLDRKKKWALGGKFSKTVAEQFEAAETFLTPGSDARQADVRYQMTIFLYSPDRAELDGLVHRARVAVQDFGVRLVREASGAAERLWFSQFPGIRQFVHAQDLYSGNVADLLSLDAPAVGLERSDWSPAPVVLMRQINGAPYKFQFHISEDQEEVGHMAMFGPTGTGKSLFMNFLIAASLKIPELRWFRFDRDLGAFPFTKCLGSLGTYLALQTDLEERDSCALNPFQMADTAANEAFLLRWLRDRAKAEDDPKALDEIGRFIKALRQPGLKLEERSLAALINTTFSRDGIAYKNLKPWADPNLYGRFVNAPRDTFDPARGGRVVSIDVTQAFADEVLAPALSDYIIHRIMNATREAKIPFGIFVDETEPMVRASPVKFGGDLRRILQEVRRARGVAALAFQRPKAIAELGLQELILGQCPTLVFFRNPRATAEEYGPFNLTDAQLAIIRGKAPVVRGKKRYVLLVRALASRQESVLIDFDLSALGDHLRMLRGGRQAIDAVVAAQQMWGDDWLPHYLHDFGGLGEDDDDDGQ